jgi:cytochrome c oxidase subunit II
VFPALAGSKVVTGPAGNHLMVVLNGKPGTAMAAFKDQLDDLDIAAVVSYQRLAWGNRRPMRCSRRRSRRHAQ